MLTKWNFAPFLALYTLLALLVYFVYFLFIARSPGEIGFYLFTPPAFFVFIRLLRTSSLSAKTLFFLFFGGLYALSLALMIRGFVAPWENIGCAALIFTISFLFRQEENNTPLSVSFSLPWFLVLAGYAVLIGVLLYSTGHSLNHALFSTASLLAPVPFMVAVMLFVVVVIRTAAVSVIMRNYTFFTNGSTIDRVIFADEFMFTQRAALSGVVVAPKIAPQHFFSQMAVLDTLSESPEFKRSLHDKIIFSHTFPKETLALGHLFLFKESDEYRFADGLTIPESGADKKQFIGLAENGVVIGYYDIGKTDEEQEWSDLNLISKGLGREVLFSRECKRAEQKGYPLIDMKEDTFRPTDLVITSAPLSGQTKAVVAGVGTFSEGADIYLGIPFVWTVVRLIAVTQSVPRQFVTAMLLSSTPLLFNTIFLWMGIALPTMNAVVLLLSCAISLFYLFSRGGGEMIRGERD